MSTVPPYSAPAFVNVPYDIIFKDGRRFLVSKSGNQDEAKMRELMANDKVEAIYFNHPVGTIIMGQQLDSEGEWHKVQGSREKARRLKQIERIEKKAERENVSTTSNQGDQENNNSY